MNLEKNPCTKNKISKKKSSFPCEFSDEVCWSSGYLKSYVTKKQPSLKAQESSTSDCFGSDLVPKLGLRKFKNGRNNILAQSLDISIQKRLCFEFEYVWCLKVILMPILLFNKKNALIIFRGKREPTVYVTYFYKYCRLLDICR